MRVLLISGDVCVPELLLATQSDCAKGSGDNGSYVRRTHRVTSMFFEDGPLIPSTAWISSCLEWACLNKKENMNCEIC